MELQYRWSQADIDALADLVADQLWNEKRKNLRIMRWTFGILFGATAILLLVVKEYALSAIFGIMAVYYMFFLLQSARSNWRKTILREQSKANKSEEKFGDRIATLSDTEISLVSKDRTTILPYTSIVALHAEDTTYFLRAKTGEYITIPKSAFHTNEEEQKFLQLINSKIG